MSRIDVSCPQCGSAISSHGERPERCLHCGAPLETATQQRAADIDLTLGSEEVETSGERDRPVSMSDDARATVEWEPARLYDFLAASQRPDELGRLGGYRVLRLLGRGGMGLVFVAEDERLERFVALKVMRPQVANDEHARARFLREAKAAAALDHDHVVAIYQVDEDHGVPFIAMPLLKGESLEERLERERMLPSDEVVRIGLQIAEGLAAAHAVQLVHRDIKPANIWLEAPRGRVKILDFGLARMTRSEDTQLTGHGAVVGTPAYMAPEQAQGGIPQPQSDLFSLGAVMYRMATGGQPFQGADVISLLSSLANDTPNHPRTCNPTLPGEAGDLIMQLLAKQPDRRPASAHAVVERLAALASSSQSAAVISNFLPPLAATSPPDDATVLNRRYVRIGRWLAAGILLLVPALLGWLMMPPDNEAKNSNDSQTGSAWYGWPSAAPEAAIAPFDASKAQEHQAAWAQYLGESQGYENSIGMRFRLIPPGAFLMGSTPSEIRRALSEASSDPNWRASIASEGPQHRVVLPQPWYLSIHEVTQQDYLAVMGTNPAHFSAAGAGRQVVGGADTARHPVEMVSWDEAVAFCAALTKLEKDRSFRFRAGSSGPGEVTAEYRLPTEAEWEFACRAGSETPLWTGSDEARLDGAAWYKANSQGSTHAVGKLQANPLGLFDIHGNVWEWVHDRWEPGYYASIARSPTIDPRGPSGGSQRVLRGGLWGALAFECRSAGRACTVPAHRSEMAGFRVALAAP